MGVDRRGGTMMTWISNMKTRTKLLLGFGLLILLVISVAGVGYEGLRTVNRYLAGLHDEHFAVALSLAETGSNLNAVRAALLAMMAAKDREVQEKQHAVIKQLTKEIDASFERLLGSSLSEGQKAKIRQVHKVWQEFRDTRDTQLIPAIYKGRLEEARALATGIQAERYRTFSEAAAQLINEAREQAARFKKDGEDRYTFSLGLFFGLSGLAVFLGVAAVVLYNRVIASPLVSLVGVLERVAGGDLTVSVETRSRDEVGRVAEATRQMVERLRTVLSQVETAASQVATASQQLSAAADQLSSGAQEQASSLEETAASLEEITGTAKQNADNASQASQLAAGSRDTAEKGGQVVTAAVEAMGAVTQASRRIADIITTIDEIAFQTNLLALNAAVEAARAGEQGRGFGVVAAEVRNLAQRSATAAKEIKALIQDSVAKVETGSELVNKSGQTLQEIVTSVKRVSDIIAEIAAASQEQSTGIDQVNKAVAQMDQVVQTNAAQTEELSSTSQALAAQAEQLRVLLGQFRLGDRGPDTGEKRPETRDRRHDRGESTKSLAVGLPSPVLRKKQKPVLASVPAGSTAARASAEDGFEEF
jgi:methyl-accepting chemotaxis protein